MKNEIRLRTIAELTEALEGLYNQQVNGKYDPKTADALNTTLKGAIYLRAKLPLDYAKLYLNAAIKKVNIPQNLLPVVE